MLELLELILLLDQIRSASCSGWSKFQEVGELWQERNMHAPFLQLFQFLLAELELVCDWPAMLAFTFSFEPSRTSSFWPARPVKWKMLLRMWLWMTEVVAYDSVYVTVSANAFLTRGARYCSGWRN